MTVTRIPNYVLAEKFHDGSSNQLYRAIRESDGAAVIIKLPRSEYPTSRELGRIHNEYQLLSELTVDGIPKVYGMEKLGRSAALVIEHLVGEPLSAVLRSRQLTVSECLSIAMDLTRILEALHTHHIIHRDRAHKDKICLRSRHRAIHRPCSAESADVPLPFPPIPAWRPQPLAR